LRHGRFGNLRDERFVKPAQDAHFDALLGLLNQQVANAWRTGAATLEMHRGLKTPANYFDRMLCGDDRIVNGAERFLAIH
jgi:hypothetical protein